MKPQSKILTFVLIGLCLTGTAGLMLGLRAKDKDSKNSQAKPAANPYLSMSVEAVHADIDQRVREAKAEYKLWEQADSGSDEAARVAALAKTRALYSDLLARIELLRQDQRFADKQNFNSAGKKFQTLHTDIAYVFHHLVATSRPGDF